MKKRVLSFKYAFKGISELIKTQVNFRIHIMAAAIVLILSYLLEINSTEWAIILICIMSVFFAESINTAIEYTVDLISPQRHPIAGKIKDIGAAAVLISSVFAAITGFVIFGPKLVSLIP